MINWSKNLPSTKPKYLAIVQLIKTLIQTDQLLPGEKLPAERSLAYQLKVDRSTVTRALNELAIQDLVYKKIGSGTFISQTPQIKSLSININWQSLLDPVSTTTSRIQDRLSQARILNHEKTIDAATDELPVELIPKLETFQLNWQTHLINNKYSSSTYKSLIDTLSHQQQLSHKISLNQQNIVVSGGAAQSLLLVLSSLLLPGDSVAFASPSYFNSTAVFDTLDIHTYSVPLINSNFNLAKLEETILKHRIKLLILNPTFENPTGETLSLKQRQQILNMCQKYQIPIIEDDVFGWLSSSDSDVPTLKSLSPLNVIYISSMSKLLGKGTRIGWIIAPQVISKRLLQVQKQLDMIPSMLAQEMVDMALNTPSFPTQLNQLISKLKQRRLAVADIFKKYQPTWKFSIPEGGFYLWITQDDPDIFTKLLKKNILVKPGPIFGASRKSFRFNVACMDKKGLNLLEEYLKYLD